jgi:hypothetical protein
LTPTSLRFIAVDLKRQPLPGTFEHALNHLIDHELDLGDFDARYKNDVTGATACPPALLVKVVLFPYSQGIVASPTHATGLRSPMWKCHRDAVPQAGGITHCVPGCRASCALFGARRKAIAPRGLTTRRRSFSFRR